MKGVNTGGVNINNLRYADDTVLVAEGPMFLQSLLIAVNEKGKPYGMEMNIIKTKSMVVTRKKPVSNISRREINPTSGQNGVPELHGKRRWKM